MRAKTQPPTSTRTTSKIIADPVYLDLHTKVLALDVAAFDVVHAMSVLTSHEHPAGIITLTTTRKPQQPAWSQILGVRHKSAWPSVFDRVLAVDSLDVPQPNCHGRLICRDWPRPEPLHHQIFS